MNNVGNLTAVFKSISLHPLEGNRIQDKGRICFQNFIKKKNVDLHIKFKQQHLMTSFMNAALFFFSQVKRMVTEI